ncbi:hypothetical protein HPP92_025441 [Vanilla planifolia]|uniref:Uncharacterized protein n=1 Tax=Vanilla planifolia TaxID=51239 RepID=A0A835PJK4_VANPL|nr:hypothetical protein HPP92_025441 [Vanilla planifolia]
MPRKRLFEFFSFCSHGVGLPSNREDAEVVQVLTPALRIRVEERQEKKKMKLSRAPRTPVVSKVKNRRKSSSSSSSATANGGIRFRGGTEVLPTERGEEEEDSAEEMVIGAIVNASSADSTLLSLS